MKRRKRKKRLGKTVSVMNNDSESNTTDLQEDLHSDLNALFHRLSGYELAEAVIKRVRRYAVACVSQSNNGELHPIEDAGLQPIQEAMRNELQHWVKYFITDVDREFVVRCHARGLSTSDAALELMNDHISLNLFGRDDALGVDLLRQRLIHSLAYLKPGTSGWPKKKYGDVWREARTEYKQSIRDVPLTSTVEHVALLAEHVETINKMIENNNLTANELHILTGSLTETLNGMHKLKVAEQPGSANLSSPQLVAVLERLTVALDSPEQLALSGDRDGLVSVLEQLIHALKTTEQKALSVESVQDADVVSNEDGNGV